MGLTVLIDKVRGHLDFSVLASQHLTAKEGEQPDSNLELEHVHGYTSGSSRTSVFFVAHSNEDSCSANDRGRAGMSIMYPAAAVGAWSLNAPRGCVLQTKVHRDDTRLK